MQTPTKCALGIMLVLIAAYPLASATTPSGGDHSLAFVGDLQAGILPPATGVQVGSTSVTLPAVVPDACLDSTFQGTTSDCFSIFPDEQGLWLWIPANGVALDRQAVASTTCAVGLAAHEADVITADQQGWAFDVANFGVDTVLGLPGAPGTPPGAPPTTLGDPDLAIRNCPDIFTHSAQRLGVAATFYDALGAPVPVLPTEYGYCGTNGDLVTKVPAGATSIAVGSKLGSEGVAFYGWFWGWNGPIGSTMFNPDPHDFCFGYGLPTLAGIGPVAVKGKL